MKLSEKQIKKLSKLVYDKLSEKKLIELIASPTDVVNRIELVIKADLHLEEEIEKQAKKTMEQFKTQVESGEIDYHKMYTMVKKQLMKEKGFTS